MKLNEKQEEMCASSKWDFSDLRALFINTTLKKSPEVSHTEGLWKINKTIFEKIQQRATRDIEQCREIHWYCC